MFNINKTGRYNHSKLQVLYGVREPVGGRNLPTGSLPMQGILKCDPVLGQSEGLGVAACRRLAEQRNATQRNDAARDPLGDSITSCQWRWSATVWFGCLVPSAQPASV